MNGKEKAFNVGITYKVSMMKLRKTEDKFNEIRAILNSDEKRKDKNN